jgi:ribosomal protein S18 acetylase RimI-like enzyme
MDDVTIRSAVPGDGRALAALEHRAWSQDSAVTQRPSATRAFFDLGHTPGQFLVVVPGEATAGGGQIAGFIRMVPPTPLPANAHVRQIQGLAVEPALRGRGLGRGLLDAACERAVSQGARRITLRVLASNEPALRLYAAAGFTVEGVLPGEFHIAGRYVDDILMGRALS